MATVGTLGILMPPSVTLIVFGIITEQSIGKLFLAGLIPGLIIALFFMLIIYGWCKLIPRWAPGSKIKLEGADRFPTGCLVGGDHFFTGHGRADERFFYSYRSWQRGDF